MNRLFLASVVIGVLSASAWGQDGQQDGRPPDGRGPRGGPDHSGWADRMFMRVADELDLDDEQRIQFEEITAPRREEMREMGQRWREVRQATREGDEERAAQLRAELPEWRGPGSGLSELADEIEPILRDDQVGKLWEIADRTQRRQDDRERYRTIIRELPDELDMDEEQREEFDQLVQSERDRMRGRMSEMRPVFEEMREAREAGDEQRLAELREQLETSRPNSETIETAFFEQLGGILDDQQRAQLAVYREGLESGVQDEQRGLDDVRDVLRAVKRLRLTSEQKDAVREIEHEAIGAYRKIGRRDREGQVLLAAEVKGEIADLLDSEQVEQFEQQLQRLGRRSRTGRTP